MSEQLEKVETMFIVRRCEFSPCRRYRYTLWREWPSTSLNPCPRWNQYLMVIGLNPSTADEIINDPTIRRCIGFAQRWGFGALCMTNIFAWRDTLPENMKRAADPVGPDNDRWLMRCAEGAGMIIAAWGVHGAHIGRADDVRRMVRRLHCLGTTREGHPKHPLYLRSNTEPVPFVSLEMEAA
jgi:hypothetical protein